ncbi:MAG: pseudouridine synthase [Candidatus Omnitrophota bacterium]|nr:pseudouridine synthase [Candidatus Omnitrophota bacterium]MDZ4243404.1 pseudouridine synthase [Candidatus Omnitrophota bacterium]
MPSNIVNKFPGKVPLERALSKLGLASRSQTREWVLAGRLQVNGKTVTDPLSRVIPEKDKFVLDGEPLQKKEWRTLLLYKPKAVVTTASDEKGRRTVFDLLPAELKHLHPVGRLDMASTGLLLLTNDTKLSAYLTDPSHAVPRVYIVTAEGEVTPEDIHRAEAGVQDQGELLKPSKITLRKSSRKESHLIVELTEGKNREIRRLLESLGHEVTHLKRVAFGGLELGDLPPGQFRDVSKEEISLAVPGAAYIWKN